MKKSKVITIVIILVVCATLARLVFFNNSIVGRHYYRGQKLPENYEPKNLEVLSKRASYLSTYQSLDARFVPAIEKLILDAEKDGMCLTVAGSFRSFNYQRELYNQIEDKYKVAVPGESEHQTGLAVDFEGCPMADGKRDDEAERLELRKDFVELPEYQWLKEHAVNYGLEESYRVDNEEKTGYPPEPWHWKFVKKK